MKTEKKEKFLDGFLKTIFWRKKPPKKYGMKTKNGKKFLNAFLKAILCNNFEIADYYIHKNIEFN